MLPHHASRKNVDVVEKVSHYFEENAAVVKAEYIIWCQKWEKEEMSKYFRMPG